MKIEAFLNESPVVALAWGGRKLDGHLSRLFHEKGMNFSSALVLVSVFFEEPLAVHPSQLAVTLLMTRGNISHAISSLEARGLLARRLDPEDARAHRLLLKPQGRKVAMQVVRTLHRMQIAFEKTMGTAQIQSFIRVARQIEQTCARADKS